MKTYRISFQGRRAGAIGILEHFTATREAGTPEAAILALYNEYEHISVRKIEVIE